MVVSVWIAGKPEVNCSNRAITQNRPKRKRTDSSRIQCPKSACKNPTMSSCARISKAGLELSPAFFLL